MAAIGDVETLRALYGHPNPRSAKKVLTALDQHCRRFIELSPFTVLSSTGPDGLGDITPRGGEPGFVTIVDDATLLLPDRPGNNRIDTLVNILGNPGVGLLFLIPGVDETLRVQGTAEILDDTDVCHRFAVGERAPKTVLRITVREAYLHCAKAFMRSRLWDPAARIDRAALPSMGEMLKDQLALATRGETQAEMIERYKETLY
ncbi:pyridoxamine 5'-phosphate oxidase, FMN-binding family [Hartmannibacter diazotrophicus]|uniref:Pyridoxamine 5'-phosphate oxidase, FMN-binding family n=1 Tax=Hartmannibacter diazotrophicus TaxID=1482074 RepID=A0A2C9D347_9HYPH|nr:pyridoxamine 5'-phosphate oxidase family protein [Hartmannibacter diazotrophicus]SON54653.1 pyridoxamine 5'-phosphate oxidase, FMN-binding family [Hartmannibacter diazotrophicus]